VLPFPCSTTILERTSGKVEAVSASVTDGSRRRGVDPGKRALRDLQYSQYQVFVERLDRNARLCGAAADLFELTPRNPRRTYDRQERASKSSG
jgi:hypothetical protein